MGGKRYLLRAGKKFTRLTVLEDNLDGTALCRCSCGSERSFRKIDLKLGATRSCGCWNTDRIRKHGMEGTSTYVCWAHMLQRCQNPKNTMFKHYGARGIKICERWKDFRNFLKDMGEKPIKKSIDRVNNDGDYKPSNCKWSTITEQMRNRRLTVKVMYGGKMTPISEIAEKNGIPRRLFADRLRRGVGVEEAINMAKFSRQETT